MPTSTRTIYHCDICTREIDKDREIVISRGSRLFGTDVYPPGGTSKIFCSSCFGKLMDKTPTVKKVEVVLTPVESFDSDLRDDSRSDDGYRGPSGRPFPTQARVTKTAGWSQPVTRAGFPVSCGHGQDGSPPATEGRFISLDRLLQTATLGMSTSG